MAWISVLLTLLYINVAFVHGSGVGSSSVSLLQLAKVDPLKAYSAWAQQHGKQDAHERFEVFKANVDFIHNHNANNPSHQLDLNEYADLTWEEFSHNKLGFNHEQHIESRKNHLATPFRHANVDPPADVDWREKGAVSPVKNQGACGSCWAFSATGAVEGINQIKTGEMVVLSEQELVDCDHETGNAGCGGGLMDFAFDYIKKNGGIDTEEDWGYYSGWGFGTWCNARKLKDRHVVTIDGYEDVPKDNEYALKQAASQQPIAVGICASPSMQFYRSGVIDTCCTGLNHGVLVAGYGKDEKTGHDYWLIKNSWGGTWGESGYFKLKYGVGEEGLCGIATAASYPTKEHDNPRVPSMCDPFGWSECPWGSTCSCNWPFFFNLFCIRHDCCPLRHGVGCADNQHCCPHEAPVCDTSSGTCSSADGAKTVQWTNKQPASYDYSGAGSMSEQMEKTAKFYRGVQTMRSQQQQSTNADQLVVE
eukprot:GHRR01000547.1.p1 GENE.GHRR01000547.1~~GHRR01000547.1.p1  ORF type:complete len:477 (+),score=130.72 GHRR01000547.1:160-1590(+)